MPCDSCRISHSLRGGVGTAALAFLLLTPGLAAQIDQGLFENLAWREIGPAVMGGRISDLAVLESNPAHFYVGVATGGLWRTVNHGTTWEPLFDEQPTASVGAVSVAPSNPNVLWVGTGEPQNRQSSPWGNGVYRSTDAGRTWEHMGLVETRHIGRIVIDPRHPDIVYVAAVGHLWGSNPERGVFKTTDGGRTWSKVLFVDEQTGAIDLVMDPGDPQTLFAAMYQRQRKAFGFNGGGPGSGIYRTTDGGASWHELTNGLPDGDMGRIGLDVFRRDGNLVYAVVEAPGTKRGVYRSTDRGETWEQRSETNPRPMYFSLLRVDPNDPERVYLGGVQLHVSEDGGRTFRDDGADAVHSDHHALWIDPGNSRHLIMGSDGGVSVSFDRAATWRMYDNLSIGQFYEIGVDMREPYFVCGGLQDNGSWCGPSATWSRLGIRNADWYNILGGDGFYTRIDPNDPTVVFAESQNGNVTRVDLRTWERASIRPTPEPEEGESAAEARRRQRWNWNTPVILSTHAPAVVYVGANMLFRSDDRGTTWTAVSGDLTRAIDPADLEIMGERLRPGVLSLNDGVSSYGTITTVSESPLNPDLLYVGTDDGNVQMTRDGGVTWTDVTGRIRNLPDRTYVSRLVASAHAEGTVYATFDGHYENDFAPYVYVSTDYGERWRAISDGLPDWSVNVIAEHPRTPGLLFVGNEIGAWVSVDRGEHWARMDGNLPTVPVDDILVHPRDNDLILGTHGRGIWILDDIAVLEVLSAETLATPARLFPAAPGIMYNVYSPQGWNPGTYAAPDAPFGALVRYYLRADQPAADDGEPAVRVEVRDASGDRVAALEGPGTAGLHEVRWDYRMPRPYEPAEGEDGGFFGSPPGPQVLPGTYTLAMLVEGATLTTDLEVRYDPRASVRREDLAARHAAVMDLYALVGPLYEAGRVAADLGEQLGDAVTLLEQHEGAPEDLVDEARALRSDVARLRREINSARSTATRTAFGMEGVSARPTPDQLGQIDDAWAAAGTLLPELNTVITERLPALYRALNDHGIRPDPGTPVEIPARPVR